MTTRLKSLVVIALVLMTAVACRSMTGQSLGTNIDNKTTTAAVKARLAAEQLQNLTWVDVDTNDGVVYLSGTAATQAQKEAAGRIASSVDGVKKVVNSIQVRTADPGPAPVMSGGAAASPATGAAGHHRVTGEIEAIDRTAGTVTVQTAAREIQILVPSHMLHGLNKGDRVSVEMGIRPLK